MQIVARARHADIQQPALLLDQLRLAGRELRREAAVDDIQDIHDVPLHALGRVDGGQSQILLVQHRPPRQIAGGVGRIESQLREEALAGRVLPRQQLQLIEVPQPRMEVLVEALEMRPVPVARRVHLPLPQPLRVPERAHQLAQLVPGGGRLLRRAEGLQ